TTKDLHPTEANWRLAAVASQRPMLAPGDSPSLRPPEAVRVQSMARWPAFIGSGHHPLILIPGGGGWSSARREPSWPAERFAVVAIPSMAERIVILRGAGAHHAVREQRASLAEPN